MQSYKTTGKIVMFSAYWTMEGLYQWRKHKTPATGVSDTPANSVSGYLRLVAAWDV